MAVERDFARANSDGEVDTIDLFTLCSRASPHWSRRDRLIETLNRKIDRFVMPVISGRDITREVPVDAHAIPALPNSYDELRAYELDGAKIGLAVLSSIQSLTTIQNPHELGEFGKVLGPAWRSAHLSLRIGQAVREFGYDKVVIFNGRHCYSRPFCDAVERGAEVIRYEQGSAGNRYICASAPVQETRVFKSLIEDNALDRAAGDEFFRERMARNPATDVSLFTAAQRPGSLPNGMIEGRTVSFFTSSSDEAAAVTDDALFGSFANQYAIALALADICRANGLQLLIRLHPHLRFKHPSWRREWDFVELARRNVLVVAPEDGADSYAIVRASHSVITTGSTIGIEAAYLGIPSAVVGNWVGAFIGACTSANTRDELDAFLAEPRRLPTAREAALRFGSFYRTAGKLLPELDVGIHPNMARIDGRIVDPIRYAAQKLRFLFRSPAPDPLALDVRSGLHAGRVVLPPGTDYSSAYGKAATSGATKVRRASTEKSFSGE
jgi:hypothetical protein